MNARLLPVACMFATTFALLLPGHPAQACSQTRPVVSTAWLATHLDRPDLVLVDIRSAQAYADGHVSGAISLPFAMPTSAWNVVSDSGLLMELPAPADLFATLGAAGITRNSYVIVLNDVAAEGVPPAYPRAQTARVALTLLYAGVREVAILDGGMQKWVQEGRALSAEVATPAPVTFDGRARGTLFVTKDQVAASLGDARQVLLDVRDAEVYDGTVIEPYAPVAGHIPGALNLPTPQIWNDDGTFKSRDELHALAAAVLGHARGRQITVYCGVGGYASAWWFVLTEVLGYRHVKLYDGSAQDWVAEPAGAMEIDGRAAR